jgi:hypothetical protein
MPSNISKINGLTIAAATAEYVAAGNVDGPLGNNSVEFSNTASYIDPTFISASAAASGFGSGGGTGTTAQTASYALSVSSSQAANSTHRVALLDPSVDNTPIYYDHNGITYDPTINKLTVGQLQATGLTGSFAGTIENATSASYAATASFVNTLNQNVTINGNLSVFGTASYTNVSSSELNIGTSLITVNTSNPTNRFGGLAVIDSGSTPQTSGSILFDSVNDQWVFIHNTSPLTSSIFIQSPQTYNDLGNEINLTTNRVPKSTNAEHIGDSNISDTGTVVSINSATQITGSLTVTGNVIATASWASNSVTASYIDPTFISASAAASGFGSGRGGPESDPIFAAWTGSAASYFAGTASYALSSAGVAGGVTSIIAGDGISVDQSTGAVTITNTGGGGGGGTNLGLVYAVSLGYLMP